MPSIEDILESLPPKPGVYLMKDAEGKIVYVGKAQNLRTRVRSYFRDSGDTRAHIQFLRARIADIETVSTDTEKEAFLLENTLIKKHQPRYNIRLRDDKTYISLRLDTAHEWPRVHRIRRRIPGGEYFGPYTSSAAVKETLRFLQRLFPLRSCRDSVLANRARPCILHQIDRCCAPCVGLVDRAKYDEYVRHTRQFLRGKRDEVVALLEAKMWEYSEAMQYEKAAAVRDRLLAVRKTMEPGRVAGHRRFDRDVVGLHRERGRVAVAVMCFRDGTLGDTHFFDFKDHGFDAADVMAAVLGQYYETRQPPRDILLASEPAGIAAVRAVLEDAREGPVRLLVPQRGEKVRLVEFARRNAQMHLERRLAGENSRDAIVADLGSKLRLPNPPRRIECFDISNIQGTFAVGSMTALLDGEPDKSGYRRFKIKTVSGQDDFASMREVLLRRYGRALREGAELPDLIVIDGGKGQLGVAVEALRELGLLGKVPVCGLAKARLKGDPGEERTRTEERVFLPNRKDPVRFDQSDPALFLLTRIRDEAHRFGVAYHRKLRSGASLKTGLEEIPGIGPRRRRALVAHFGSVARLRAATLDDIAAAPGITRPLAEKVHAFLHRTPDPGT